MRIQFQIPANCKATTGDGRISLKPTQNTTHIPVPCRKLANRWQLSLLINIPIGFKQSMVLILYAQAQRTYDEDTLVTAPCYRGYATELLTSFRSAII